MASLNGTLAATAHAPAPPSPAAAKRKLTVGHGKAGHSAPAAPQSPLAHSAAPTHALQHVLDDILAVLRRHDTQPSILAHPLSSSIARAPSGEADAKRTKWTPPSTPVTIAGMIQDGSYVSLQALQKDVDAAAAELLASSSGSDATAAPAAPSESASQAQVLAFQAVVKNLVEREAARRVRVCPDERADPDAPQVAKVEVPPAIPTQEEQGALPSRTVLTLYGSAPPKQLFSSLQQPYTVPPTKAMAAIDTSVCVTLPLRESTLPNVISTTEVYPLPDLADKQKQATIGHVFHAPAHLPQISPPKSARPTTSKGNNTITFAPQETVRPRRKASQSYAHQTLATGFWLGYGGVDKPKDQTSPTAKQKSRQRALSMGEAQQPPSEAILVAVQQAKEEALFRSVYSSFAPTRDDSSAIVPEETKNMVWWQKVGEKRFNETFPIDPELLEADGSLETVANGAVDEEEGFKDAVQNFIPVQGDVFSDSHKKSQDEKDTDEVLKDISELLETLASYQRIRNLSLTTNPRTPVVQNSSLATLAGSPLTPSSEEIDVYQILKSQLTLLISQLPPYAVAKLNGDQMDELNISRTILFDTIEYKGVLEEDQLSRLAKAPPVMAQTPTTLTRAPSSVHAHYPQSIQYNRPTSSAHPSNSRIAYSQQQSLQRSSSIHTQRSPSGSSQTFPPNYVSNSRPGYAATPFNQQQSRSSYNTTPSGQYYPQRSAQASSYTNAAASQFYGSTPQTQPQNRYVSQQTQNGFYAPRSQNVAPMYNGAQASQPRTASPIKPAPTPGQPGFSSRPAYATPVSGGQMRSTYYGPSQYGTPQAAAASTPFTSGAGNAQQMMVERQQAQAAAQSQARLAAHNSFSSRQGSGTPQPASGG